MKTLPLIPILMSALVIAMVSTASAQIWRWVGEDGILTFSNSKPPDQARHVAPVVSSSNEDADRKPPWPNDAQSLPGPYGEVLIAESQTHPDESDEAWEYDCCRRYIQPHPHIVFDAPYVDYAYSRRYLNGPRRHFMKPFKGPHYRHYNRQYHYGYRRYDRHYYSSSYRYRFSAPHYRSDGKKSYHGEHYGRKPAYFDARGRAYRGIKTRTGHGWGDRGRSGHGRRR